MFTMGVYPSGFNRELLIEIRLRLEVFHHEHVFSFGDWRSGACFSKVPRTFRARKASRQAAICLF